MLYYNTIRMINKLFGVIYLDKKIIRREVLTKRAALGKEGILSLSKKVIENLAEMDYYKNAKTIFTFISFGSEIDTHEFIKKGISEDKRMLVPVTFHQNREMKPSLLKNFNDLEIGYYNILTPKKESIEYIDPKEIDLVIVPGAAFDKEGYRVGYGGGFYDRFLSEKISPDVPKIAIGFDLQIIPQVPREEFDFPVDYIVTESGIIECKQDYK